MSDLNVWLGQGRLTRDGELRYLPSGQAVMDISIASNRIWNNKEGVRQEKTAFVDVTLWGKTAESLVQYLKKGSHITVEGRLDLEQWEGKEGEKRSKLKVTADRIHLSPKNGMGAINSENKLNSNEYATSDVGGDEDDVGF